MAGKHVCFIVQCALKDDGVPGLRWGTLPQPLLSFWIELWQVGVEAEQIHGQYETCSTKEHPTCSGPPLCPPDLHVVERNQNACYFRMFL